MAEYASLFRPTSSPRSRFSATALAAAPLARHTDPLLGVKVAQAAVTRRLEPFAALDAATARVPRLAPARRPASACGASQPIAAAALTSLTVDLLLKS